MTAPLNTFPAVRSRNSELVRDAVLRTYGARRLDLPRGGDELDVWANHWQSENIAISYCSYGAPVQVEFPGADFYRLQLSLQGGAAVKVGKYDRQVTKDETSVIPPDTSLINNFPRGYKQVVLRVNRESLTNKLAALTGVAPRSEIKFEPMTRVESLASLQRLLTFFIQELDSLGSLMPKLALVELEQSLVVSFLCSNTSNYSALLENPPRSAGSWQLRRAEDYIEAHWNQPITIEAIAQVASTSARTLFHHFRHSRGQSPMEFVKQLRLQHARDMLMRGDAVSVTETALACGFSNLGHFAKDYLKRFGEKPSETIKKSRTASSARPLG